MYFGLINVLTYFMALMSKVFMEYLDKFIVVFIDGILVYSMSEVEHEEHLCLVSQKLQDPRLIVCQDKQVRVLDEASVFLELRHFWKKEYLWVQVGPKMC
jgi:hypothetical protein